MALKQPELRNNIQLCYIIQIFVHLKFYINNLTTSNSEQMFRFDCNREDNILEKNEYLKGMIEEGIFIEFYFSVKGNENFSKFLRFCLKILLKKIFFK